MEQKSDVQQHHPSVLQMSPVGTPNEMPGKAERPLARRNDGRNAQRSLIILAI
jgi:hypothetical protein